MKSLKITLGAMAFAVALSGISYADDTTTQTATDTAAVEATPKADPAAATTETAKPVAKKAKAKRAPVKKAMKKKKALKTEAKAAPVSDTVATAAAANETSAAAEAAVIPSAPSAPVQTSAADSASLSPLNRMSASYTLWITGPTVKAIDGKEEAGSALVLDQFATVGYKVSSKWKVSGTAFWTNKTDHNEAEGVRQFNWNNPYLTAANSSITKSTRYGTNLSAYVRYYMPLSHSSADNVGKRVDTKYGVARLFVGPSKTFMDGKLTLSGDVYIHRSFAGAKPSEEIGEQRDWRLYLYPRVAYQFTDAFDAYAAYFNDWEHVRLDKNRQGGGRWQSFNDKHLLELGVNWSPIKNLAFNPYVEFPQFHSKETTINLIADFAFL